MILYIRSISIRSLLWHIRFAGRPVKYYSAWGLYDMHGNVWEWYQDWYGDYSSESVTDPTGPKSSYYRIVRGGNWETPCSLQHFSQPHQGIAPYGHLWTRVQACF